MRRGTRRPPWTSRSFRGFEDGYEYSPGRAFGARGEVDGEVVFNTSMTGYQEILTDPSYHGQIVTMTYPLIGNYGVNDDDTESGRPWVRGFVIRELSRLVSNYRAGGGLDDYLARHGVIGIEGIDTRAARRAADAGAQGPSRESSPRQTLTTRAWLPRRRRVRASSGATSPVK